jgi:hypothetical protein
VAQASRQDPDLIKTEIGLWCKFAHVSAKGISISLFLQPEEEPLGQVKGRTLLGRI